MAHLSIIGTGNMGQAIAGIVTKGGNTVELFGSEDTNKAVTGGVVILAVVLPPLGVADEDITAAEVGEHGCRDVTGGYIADTALRSPLRQGRLFVDRRAFRSSALSTTPARRRGPSCV